MKKVGFAATAGLCALLAFYAGTQVWRPRTAQHPITHRPIAGMATDAGWMDRASRETEEDPDKALALIGIKPGMVVADIGAGSGYMTMRLAPLVGSGGHVFATDVQPALLRLVQQKLANAHTTNVTVVLGTDTDAKLPPQSLDVALLVDVYHEFEHPREMLRSLRRSLKWDGRLVLVEYRGEDATIPIASTHRLTVTGARVEIEPEGFVLDQVLEGLPRQHILVFRLSTDLVPS